MNTTINTARAAATLAMLAISPASAKDVITQNQSVKNVVLVHGAFADGTGWRAVYDRLTQQGYRVTIVQTPPTSLEDDVAATKRALAQHDGPTILVGHSWGGTVITEADVDPNVAVLVYVSVLSPDAGETTAQQYEGFAPATEFVLDTREYGSAYVARDKFKAGFAHDVSDADATFMANLQVPIKLAAFGTKLKKAA